MSSNVTERQMLAWLNLRYGTVGGNGYRWVYAAHVRSAAGFDATRTADAVAMDLWPSKGLELHGHEVKVSRSDWLRELQKPGKWLGVGQYMDRWWLAVPDAAIVRPGELPPDWGMLVCNAAGVRVARPAPRLNPRPVDRSFMACLLRAATKTAVLGASEAVS